jgi:hypothetical protein
MKALVIGLFVLVCSLSVVATTQDPDDYNPTDTGNDLRRALNARASVAESLSDTFKAS